MKTCILGEAEFTASSGLQPQAQTMNDIQTIDLDAAEAHMLTLPQVECPIEHIFGPGIYIRQIFMPKDSIVLGHSHKLESVNMVLKGRLSLLEGGVRREVAAPYIFTSGLGRKVAYVLEDCVFQNIYATEETDLEKLEEMCVEKSDTFKARTQ